MDGRWLLYQSFPFGGGYYVVADYFPNDHGHLVSASGYRGHQPRTWEASLLAAPMDMLTMHSLITYLLFVSSETTRQLLKAGFTEASFSELRPETDVEGAAVALVSYSSKNTLRPRAGLQAKVAVVLADPDTHPAWPGWVEVLVGVDDDNVMRATCFPPDERHGWAPVWFMQVESGGEEVHPADADRRNRDDAYGYEVEQAEVIGMFRSWVQARNITR